MNTNSPLTCAIAFAFIGGMLWVILTANNSKELSLSPQQTVIMEIFMI